LWRAYESTNARWLACGWEPKYKTQMTCLHEYRFKFQSERAGVLTAIIDIRMKPAAPASNAAFEEYTRELTDDDVKTRPAERKPTI
jgi:hypothetical protein